MGYRSETLRATGIRSDGLLDRIPQDYGVALIALVAHLEMLVYDEHTQFQAFVWGDRGVDRLGVFDRLAQIGHAPLLPAMIATRVVPGEYLFTIAPWLAFGPAGVIGFQIVLAVIACWLVARLAGQVVPWRPAALTCGLVYAFLPQNLAYPHQLVTEAVATPLCVGWLYLTLAALRSGRLAPFVAAGLCIGFAILTRPSIVLVLPISFALAALYPAARGALRRPGLYAMGALGMAPLLIWVALFTAQTGHVGYTDGIANLGWNLRSKAAIVEQGNGIPLASDLQIHDGTISTGRFLAEVGRHKGVFAKAFALDTFAVFGRGNSTKMTIDYFGIQRDQKDWRQRLIYAHGAAPNEPSHARQPVFLLEAAATLVTALFSLFCVWQAVRIGWGLVRDRTTPSVDYVFVTVLTTALMLTTFFSAQMVDQSQGRLRNPAEGAMIVFAAMVLAQRRRETRG